MWKGSSPCKDLTCGVGCQSKENHGMDYDGKGNTTVTGRSCQKWSTKEPWPHSLGRFGDHNYCRNPGSPSGVWCYTTDTDPDHRWEFCPIPLCGTNPRCPPYASQLSPGLSCSSPGLECPFEEECCCGECGLLTYTCTATSEWQPSSPCANPTCIIGCQNEKTAGGDYQGAGSTTVGGFPCRQWSSQHPYNHVFTWLTGHNYCRNPDGDPGVWCYTTTALKSSYILRRFTFNF